MGADTCARFSAMPDDATEERRPDPRRAGLLHQSASRSEAGAVILT